ncbi:unnamed protein product [Hydatigera taeniaeformis]|uniref:Fibronectin type-III domain-containing protein n=1 Tax=Hydatigena taeniaeformis TaxID=6205 RepID=A0A0R3XDA7_HYDTA|nr:unnamed protein product [Hydatigera taeniaeformis]
MEVQLCLMLLAAATLYGGLGLAKDVSVPRDVRLRVVDPHTVKMTWKRPSQPNGRLIGYLIAWRLGSGFYEIINLNVTKSYTFRDLQPGRTLAASVSAYTRKGGPMKRDYVSHFSEEVRISIPHSKRREFILASIVNLLSDSSKPAPRNAKIRICNGGHLMLSER